MRSKSEATGAATTRTATYPGCGGRAAIEDDTAGDGKCQMPGGGRLSAWLDDVVRAQRPARLPVVLTREEVRTTLLLQIHGVPRLMAMLLYGAGLRLLAQRARSGPLVVEGGCCGERRFTVGWRRAVVGR